MRKLEKYEYTVTVTQEVGKWRISIDNTPYNRVVRNNPGLTSGIIISNIGAFLNYLDTLR